MTTCQETNEAHLIPLPVPGLYYKYIDRNGRISDNGGCRSSSKKKKKKKEQRLSTDPAGLQGTLDAQLLDKPIHPSSSLSNENEEGA